MYILPAGIIRLQLYKLVNKAAVRLMAVYEDGGSIDLHEQPISIDPDGKATITIPARNEDETDVLLTLEAVGRDDL